MVEKEVEVTTKCIDIVLGAALGMLAAFILIAQLFPME